MTYRTRPLPLNARTNRRRASDQPYAPRSSLRADAPGSPIDLRFTSEDAAKPTLLHRPRGRSSVAAPPGNVSLAADAGSGSACKRDCGWRPVPFRGSAAATTGQQHGRLPLSPASAGSPRRALRPWQFTAERPPASAYGTLRENVSAPPTEDPVKTYILLPTVGPSDRSWSPTEGRHSGPRSMTAHYPPGGNRAACRTRLTAAQLARCSRFQQPRRLLATA